MTKLRKKTAKNNIDSNIKKAFEVIDAHLPRNYVKEVQTILPDVEAGTIRLTKLRKAGNPKIIAALKKVAENTRDMLN